MNSLVYAGACFVARIKITQSKLLRKSSQELKASFAMEFARVVVEVKLSLTFIELGGSYRSRCFQGASHSKKLSSKERGRSLPLIRRIAISPRRRASFCLQALSMVFTVILFRVPNRKRQTLLPIIQRHILPGTTIHSDEFTPYRTLHNHGYFHLTVNHSENFLDPFTGVHTNTVEGLCSAVKRKLKRMNGTRYDNIPEYLDEFMWKRQFNQPDRFLAIIRDIAAGY